MTVVNQKPPPAVPRAQKGRGDAKKERLAKALRANLLRRKQPATQPPPGQE